MKPKTKTAGSSTAENADRHDLYERAVQDTPSTVLLIEAIHEHHAGKAPLKLREDFCGTARLCADWVRSRRDRRAVGLDLDPDPLAWGKTHHIENLSPSQRDRIQLFQRDVLQGTTERHDTVVAFNFSYWTFRDRPTLLRYFSTVYASLKKGGTFIIDLHGGPDAQYQLSEEIEKDGFSYTWEQEAFDPINNFTTCHIHFGFPDGSKIPRAFTYEWRVWSLPELRDLLAEAGFRGIQVWWDDDKDNDIYRPRESAQNVISWIAYISAQR